ncbi:hypothetical protein CTEN210_03622 [Chaetoceros tenuissimus]|uniref:Tyrosyl-DNA phosphodiesterase n=1 Tax=Chaetoceros tenuissimus TaxID=426638 RepID=A0AAD3H1I5_9STRA|nr:hypothetical protein CTEN210_03622 [Chaetoceros tenuissimus]
MEKRQRPSLSSADIAWLDSSEDEGDKKKPAVASFQTASSLLQQNATFASTANGHASAKRASSGYDSDSSFEDLVALGKEIEKRKRLKRMSNESAEKGNTDASESLVNDKKKFIQESQVKVTEKKSDVSMTASYSSVCTVQNKETDNAKNISDSNSNNSKQCNTGLHETGRKLAPISEKSTHTETNASSQNSSVRCSQAYDSVSARKMEASEKEKTLNKSEAMIDLTADDTDDDEECEIIETKGIPKQNAQKSDTTTATSLNGFCTGIFQLFQTVLDKSTSAYISNIRQMLDIESTQSNIQFMIITNYILNPPFLLDEIPELLSYPRVIIFYEALESEIIPMANIEYIQISPKGEPTRNGNSNSCNPLKYKFPFGCHHTKMFIVGYEDKLRVIVHTANLRHGDFYQKAQGAYIQDFSLKVLTGENQTSKNDFEETLIMYMKSYGYNREHNWTGNGEASLVEELERYDYSSAKVVLIPSVPGYYRTPDKSSHQGYLKVKATIEKHASTTNTSCGQIICQFSSIGALSLKWMKDFLSSLSVTRGRRISDDLQGVVKLVYPTVDEIKDSIEGYIGGCSVPGTKKNLSKPFLKNLFCKWSSRDKSNIHKGKNVPHIKTFYQLSADSTSMEWFMLGSHNLSKAAWGERINNHYGESLRINSWELSVFVAPSLLDGASLIPCNNKMGNNGDNIPMIHNIPLPYNIDPKRYGENDEPWAVDVQYQVEDNYGRVSARDF